MDTKEIVYDNKVSINSDNTSATEKNHLLPAVAFITSVAGMSFLGGFGAALGVAKKKDPHMFNKGVLATREMHEAGATLALRALGWGTVYSVAGVSVICGTIWILMGAHNLRDFRIKVGNMLPKIPRNEPPQSRTEFEGLRDLLEYLSEEGTSKQRTKSKPEESEDVR